MSSYYQSTTDEYSDRRGDTYETETTTYDSYGQPPPPQVPPPWIARWDERDQRYFFINERTGERTFDFPQAYGGGGGYERDTYYQQPAQTEYVEERREGHGGRNALLAGGAGLIGGAALMYEGEKVHDDWKRDEYRAEDRFDNGIQDVEDLPDDAARWTGRKVQDVEDIPQDVEYGYDRMKYGVEDRVDNAVYDVEDAPEEVAGWAGRKVGDVERFDDNVDNSYDEGRYEGRTDDRW